MIDDRADQILGTGEAKSTREKVRSIPKSSDNLHTLEESIGYGPGELFIAYSVI